MSERSESFAQEFRGKERDHRGYDVFVPADGSQPFSVPKGISEVRFASAEGDLGPLAVFGIGPKVISIIDETHSAGPQLIGASSDYKASHGNPDDASALSLNADASARFERIAQELAKIFLDEIMRQWSCAGDKPKIIISLDAMKNKFGITKMVAREHGELTHEQKAYAVRRSKYIENLIQRVSVIILPTLEAEGRDKISQIIEGKNLTGYVSMIRIYEKGGLFGELTFERPLMF